MFASRGTAGKELLGIKVDWSDYNTTNSRNKTLAYTEMILSYTNYPAVSKGSQRLIQYTWTPIESMRNNNRYPMQQTGS
jgi:hypothetical protein